MIDTSAIVKSEKNRPEGSWKAGKGFNLLTSNEDVNDINKIVKSIEKSGT